MTAEATTQIKRDEVGVLFEQIRHLVERDAEIPYSELKALRLRWPGAEATVRDAVAAKARAEEAEAECQRLARRMANLMHRNMNLEHRLGMLKNVPGQRSVGALILVIAAFACGPALAVAYQVGGISPVPALGIGALMNIFGGLFLPNAMGLGGERATEEVEHG